MPQKPDLAKHEEWRRRLRDFDRANVTIAEFCRRVGVPVWSFYYWQQRLRSGIAGSGRHRNGTTPSRQIRARHAGTKPSLKFVPIQITGQSSIEVHLPNGARVTVPCHEHDAIGAVIAALMIESSERRPC